MSARGKFAWLIKIAVADGKFDDKELAMMVSYARNNGLSQADIDEVRKNTQLYLTHIPTDVGEKREFFKDLWRMVSADGKLDAAEMKLLGQLGGVLGFTMEDVTKLLAEVAEAKSKPSTASSDQFAFLDEPSKPASKGQFDFLTNAASDAQLPPPKAQPAAPAAGNVPAGQQRRWHVSIGGKQQGPFTDVELRAMASRGELTPDSHIWKNGMAQWAKASQLKGLFS
jgi:tellurite resistance protein